MLSRWKLTLESFPSLAPVVLLGRLRARLQSLPAPGSGGPERGWMRRDKRDKQTDRGEINRRDTEGGKA